MNRDPCPHLQFSANVVVNRLEDSGGFLAEVRVTCVECGAPFRFLGVSAGLDFTRPMVSIDELELRCPIEPERVPRLQAKATFVMPIGPPTTH